jgi:hypothetical protein
MAPTAALSVTSASSATARIVGRGVAQDVVGALAEQRANRLGRHHRGRHAVDAHAPRRQFDRQIAHQRFGQRLGDADRGVVRDHHPPAAAGQEEDRAAGRQERQGGAHEIVQREAVDPDRGGEFGAVERECRCDQRAHRAMHELIEPVGLSPDRLDHRSRPLGRADIALDRVAARAERLDCAAGARGGGLVGVVVQEHRDAGRREGAGDLEPDALGPAGHQNGHVRSIARTILSDNPPGCTLDCHAG